MFNFAIVRFKKNENIEILQFLLIKYENVFFACFESFRLLLDPITL